MSKHISPLKAIRLKCRDCQGNSPKGVSECSIEDCALHPFRSGKNPYRKQRVMSEEQRQAAAERLARARAERSEA